MKGQEDVHQLATGADGAKGRARERRGGVSNRCGNDERRGRKRTRVDVRVGIVSCICIQPREHVWVPDRDMALASSFVAVLFIARFIHG